MCSCSAHSGTTAHTSPPGDFVSTYPRRLPGTIFEPFAPVLDAGAELLAVLGNHDVKKGNAEAQIELLGMPGRWWARSINGVLIVGLDSNSVNDLEQQAWLEMTMQRSAEQWRIALVHHPPYSAGYQGSSYDARSTFAPFFERHGVQLVLSGHDR